MIDNQKIPVTVLTGFLGAGKTTVLRKMIASEAYGETALLINEFGEVGIDQHLVEGLTDDIVLLDSGCVCCQIRGELKDAILDLYTKRQNGIIPNFKRIIVETTGLAEPGPIAATIFSDPVLSSHFRLASIVTVVDAVAAKETAQNRQEWYQQVAAADMLYISKVDLTEDEGALTAKRLCEINPGANILVGSSDEDIARILQESIMAETAWANPVLDDHSAKGHHSKNQDTVSFVVNIEKEMNWVRFGVWLSALLHAHGDKILRVKGILNIGEDFPILFNAVQHIVYPPEPVTTPMPNSQKSKLVFIVSGLQKNDILHSFDICVNNPAE